MFNGRQGLHSQVRLVMQNPTFETVPLSDGHLSPVRRLKKRSPLARARKLFDSRAWHKDVKVDPVAPPRAWRCQLRSCPARSRDGATFVADTAAVTSEVVLWRPLAWSPVLRENQRRAVGLTGAL